MLLRATEYVSYFYELLYVEKIYCSSGKKSAPLQTLPEFTMTLLATEKDK
jgi:hypothetical protein